MAIDIEEEKEPQDKMKYAYLIEEANKKWEAMGPEGQKLWLDMEDKNLDMFLMLWNCIKRIESELHINVMGIVKDEWVKQFRQRGQEIATNYKEHGLKELHDAIFAHYEGISKSKWIEFNDRRLLMRKTYCPPAEFFRRMVKTDEELKEIAEVHCSAEEALVEGFNPELECAGIPKPMVVGCSHCTYFIEDHGRK